MSITDLRQRVNAAAFAKLGDAAVFNGVAVTGKFIANPAIELGMVTTNPVFQISAADAGMSPRGKTLAVNGANYTVSYAERPDESGYRILQLDLV